MIYSLSMQANEMHPARMGYLAHGLNDGKYKDIRIALSLWVEHLAKKNNIDVDMTYYELPSEIAKDYKSSKLEFITLNPLYYLEYAKSIDALTKEYWTVHRESEIFESYVILVRNDSNIKTMADLEAKYIATRSDNYLGKIFLDTELLKANHKESKSFLGGYLYTKQFSTAILNTFFAKVDACIVPENSLDLVAEMNPVVKNKLHVLKKSEKIFFPIIGLFHTKTKQIILDKFKDNVSIIRNTPGGRNILNLFRMQGFTALDYEDIVAVKKYYNDYLRLREKNVKK